MEVDEVQVSRFLSRDVDDAAAFVVVVVLGATASLHLHLGQLA